MTRYAAFLRAINVGGNRKVPMADLRIQLEALGLADVVTYINSGNVLFESDETDEAALERRIEDRLRQTFGFEVPTLVRPAGELVTLATADPFGAAAAHDDAVVYVAFLREAPAPEQMDNLQPYVSEIDTLHLDGRHLFWLRRRDLGESAVTIDRLERALDTQATTRNMTTLVKMVGKFRIMPA